MKNKIKIVALYAFVLGVVLFSAKLIVGANVEREYDVACSSTGQNPPTPTDPGD